MLGKGDRAADEVGALMVPAEPTASAVHEMNNPLTVLSANTELLYDALTAHTTGEAIDAPGLLEAIAEMRAGLQRLSALVQRLEEYSSPPRRSEAVPLAAVAQTGTSGHATGGKEGGLPSVLVVDDEPLVARAIARALSGFAVEALTTGEAALDRLARGPRPDVVVCDLMLPGLTGMDIFERACLGDPQLSTRFLFISGGAFTARTRAFYDAHVAVFVEKPVLPADLRARVQQILDGSKP